LKKPAKFPSADILAGEPVDSRQYLRQLLSGDGRLGMRRHDLHIELRGTC
jgi:hypothetical protein